MFTWTWRRKSLSCWGLRLPSSTPLRSQLFPLLSLPLPRRETSWFGNSFFFFDLFIFHFSFFHFYYFFRNHDTNKLLLTITILLLRPSFFTVMRALALLCKRESLSLAPMSSITSTMTWPTLSRCSSPFRTRTRGSRPSSTGASS